MARAPPLIGTCAKKGGRTKEIRIEIFDCSKLVRIVIE